MCNGVGDQSDEARVAVHRLEVIDIFHFDRMSIDRFKLHAREKGLIRSDPNYIEDL